jgi:hypothetical protein
MKLYTKDGQRAAKEFIFSHARTLEKTLYLYEFENGSQTDVLTALAAFQNPDGGFGHALEPDFRSPDSSALATSITLDILRELQIPAEHPLVSKALAYLVQTYDRVDGVWRIVPLTGDASPHAPWWNQDRIEETFDHFCSNPTAELVGYLWTYAALVPTELKEQALISVLTYFETLPEKISGDTLLCYLRLYAAPNLPQDAHARLKSRLPRMIAASVETNPEKWGGYCLKPFWVIPSPEAPFVEVIADALQSNLDYEIETQCTDGSWRPNWSWFGQFPDDWPAAERDWRGKLTLQTLKALKNFGRFG